MTVTKEVEYIVKKTSNNIVYTDVADPDRYITLKAREDGQAVIDRNLSNTENFTMEEIHSLFGKILKIHYDYEVSTDTELTISDEDLNHD